MPYKQAYDPEYARKWYRKNRDKVLRRTKKWRLENIEKDKSSHRWAYLKRAYKLSKESFLEMVDKQLGKCPICLTILDLDGKNSANKVHVDHDHTCCPSSKSCGKCVRGLICNNCNISLGSMNDDPARLRNAANYLEAYNTLMWGK